MHSPTHFSGQPIVNMNRAERKQEENGSQKEEKEGYVICLTHQLAWCVLALDFRVLFISRRPVLSICPYPALYQRFAL